MRDIKAWHNKAEFKNRIVERLRNDFDLGRIRQGQYWWNGHGCLLGCLTRAMGNSHRAAQTLWGIPLELAHVAEYIFESFDQKSASAFAVTFVESLPVGADLSNTWVAFSDRLIHDDQLGVAKRFPAESEFGDQLRTYRNAFQADDPIDQFDYAMSAWDNLWSRHEGVLVARYFEKTMERFGPIEVSEDLAIRYPQYAILAEPHMKCMVGNRSIRLAKAINMILYFYACRHYRGMMNEWLASLAGTFVLLSRLVPDLTFVACRFLEWSVLGAERLEFVGRRDPKRLSLARKMASTITQLVQEQETGTECESQKFALSPNGNYVDEIDYFMQLQAFV